jgi:hypothetical protein
MICDRDGQRRQNAGQPLRGDHELVGLMKLRNRCKVTDVSASSPQIASNMLKKLLFELIEAR